MAPRKVTKSSGLLSINTKILLVIGVAIGGLLVIQSDYDIETLKLTADDPLGRQTAFRKVTGLNDIFFRSGVVPERVWEDIIQEGARLQTEGKTPGIVMEVGMHRATQCLQAAQAGLSAHCVEPSPKSFARVEKEVNEAPAETKKHVTLYNVAAGGSSEGTVPFTASGGTGDHVGQHDMWRMEIDASPAANDNRFTVIQVPAKRLDDIIKDTREDVLLLKVDTQGFEPTVFSGLTESIQQHKVKYLLFEYWPRGMDLLAGKKDACIGAELLQNLADNGYTLYAFGVWAHPKAPKGWQSIKDRPFDNFEANCRWFFDIEKRVPSAEYKMGYWSDVLAVAPGAPAMQATTKTGQALSSTVASS